MIAYTHSFIEALTSDTRQAFYDQHKPIAHVMHLMVFLLPLAGVRYPCLLVHTFPVPLSRFTDREHR